MDINSEKTSPNEYLIRYLIVFLFIIGNLTHHLLLNLLNGFIRHIVYDEEFSIEMVKALDRGKFKWRMMSGVMFGLMAYIVGWNPELIVYLLFGATLITGLYCDIMTMAVPTVIMTTGAGLILLTRLFIGEDFLSYISAAVIFYIGFYVLHLINRNGFGGADVEIIGIIALTFGMSDTYRIVLMASMMVLVEYVSKWITVRVRSGKGLGKDSLKEKKAFYPYLDNGVVLFLILLA